MLSTSALRPPFGFKFGAVPQGSDGEGQGGQSGVIDATDQGNSNIIINNNENTKHAVGVAATTDADTGTRCYSLKASEVQADSVLSLVPDADEKGRNLIVQVKPLSKAAGISLLLTFACHEGFVADVTLDTDAGDQTVVLGPCEPEDILEYEDLASDIESDGHLSDDRDENSAEQDAGSQQVIVHAETSSNANGDNDDNDDNDEWEWEGEEADTDAAPIGNASASEAEQQSGRPASAEFESEDEASELPTEHRGRHLRMYLQVGKWNNLEVNLAALARGVFGSRFECCLGFTFRVKSDGGENSCLVRSDMRFRSTRGRGTKLDLMRKLEGEAFKYKDSRQVSLVDSHDIDFGDLHLNGGKVYDDTATSGSTSSSGSSTLKYTWSQNAESCDVYFAAPPSTVGSNVSVSISSEREGASSVLRISVFGKEIFAGLLANSVVLDPCPEKSVQYDRWNVIHQPHQVHQQSQVFVHVVFRKKSVAPAVGCWWAQVFENEQGVFKEDVVDHVDDMALQADSDNDDDSDDFNIGSPAVPRSSSQPAAQLPKADHGPGWSRYVGVKIDVDRRICHPEDNAAAALEAMFPFLEMDLQLKVLAMFHARRHLPTCGRALAALIRGPVEDKLRQFGSAAVGGPAASSPFWAVRSAAAILRASASTKAATRVWPEHSPPGQSLGCEPRMRASRDLYMTPPSLGYDLDVDADAVHLVLNGDESSKTDNVVVTLPQLVFGPARSDVLKVTQLTMEALPHDYGCLWGLSDVDAVKLGAGSHKIGGKSFAAVCGGTTAANVCCRVAPSTRVFGPGVLQAVQAVKPFEANSELSAAPEKNLSNPIAGARSTEPSSSESPQHQDAKQQRFSEQKIRRAEWMKALTTLQSLLAQTGQVLKRGQSLKSHARVLLGTRSLQRLDELAAELNLEPSINAASQSHAAMIRCAQARLATRQPSAAHVASLLDIGKSFIAKFPKSSLSLLQLVRQLTFLGVDNSRGYDVEYDVEDEDSDSEDDDDIEFECLVQEKFVRRPRVDADSESRLSQNSRKRGGARLTGGRRKRNTVSTLAITDTRSGNQGQDATETVALSSLSTQSGANTATVSRGRSKATASRLGSEIEATALCKGDAVEVNILRTPRDHAKAKYELVVGESQREQHDVPRSCLRRPGANAPVSLGEPLDVGDEVEVESRKTTGKWRKAVVMGRSDLGKRKGNRGDWRTATVVRVRSSACLLARRSIFAAHFSLLRSEIEHVTMALIERINKTTGGASTVRKAIEGANMQLPTAKISALASDSQSSPTMVALIEAIDTLNNAIGAARSFQEALDRFKSAPKGPGNTPPSLSRDLLQVFGRMVRHDKEVLRTLTAAARAYMSGDGSLPRVNS